MEEFEEVSPSNQSLALMLNGASLAIVLEDETLRVLVNKVFEISSSVIIFRSSPSEKA